jgi:alcohol dehydrogenase class IV
MEAARRASAAVRALRSDLGMPERLTEIGFQENDIGPALEFLFSFQAYGMENNPRDATREDLRRIYTAAL